MTEEEEFEEWLSAPQTYQLVRENELRKKRMVKKKTTDNTQKLIALTDNVLEFSNKLLEEYDTLGDKEKEFFKEVLRTTSEDLRKVKGDN